jgi:hypothetical protein
MEMGNSRTRDGAVGIVAMTGAARLRRLCLIPLLLMSLGGCRFAGDLVAAAAGGASGAATANPLVGVAVGVGVHSAIDATFSYVLRKRQQAEQDAIAGEIATMMPGERRLWKIEHDVPVGNEHGEVTVTRAFTTRLTACKELAFSVEDGNAAPNWYTTAACYNGAQWKWALAEPSVERWGSLQ